LQTAVKTAIQAFEDGLFRVFTEDKKIKDPFILEQIQN
jgi:hypothetical protein